MARMTQDSGAAQPNECNGPQDQFPGRPVPELSGESFSQRGSPKEPEPPPGIVLGQLAKEHPLDPTDVSLIEGMKLAMPFDQATSEQSSLRARLDGFLPELREASKYYDWQVLTKERNGAIHIIVLFGERHYTDLEGQTSAKNVLKHFRDRAIEGVDATKYWFAGSLTKYFRNRDSEATNQGELPSAINLTIEDWSKEKQRWQSGSPADSGKNELLGVGVDRDTVEKTDVEQSASNPSVEITNAILDSVGLRLTGGVCNSHTLQTYHLERGHKPGIMENINVLLEDVIGENQIAIGAPLVGAAVGITLAFTQTSFVAALVPSAVGIAMGFSVRAGVRALITMGIRSRDSSMATTANEIVEGKHGLTNPLDLIVQVGKRHLPGMSRLLQSVYEWNVVCTKDTHHSQE